MLVAAALLLALVAGYGIHHEYQKRMLRQSVMAWVVDAGAQLRAVLAGGAGKPGAADEMDEIRAQEARLDAVARNLEALRALNGSRQRVLVEAADRYLHGTREILRQAAASRRHRHVTTVGLRELWEHMASRYEQGPGWTTEAVRRKELLEREYSRYRNTTEALATLLDGYGEDRARLAPLMDVKSLPEEAAARAARERALTGVKLMASEMDKLRRLPRA